MTTPLFKNINDIEALSTYIEETLPDLFFQPQTESTLSWYNDRIDLMALRIYGTNHEVVLRTLLWANDWSVAEALRIFPEGETIITPPIIAVYYTKEQTRI